MYHFSLDKERQRGEEHEPLFTWGPAAFEQQSPEYKQDRSIWETDDEPRSGRMRRLEAWWYSLAPHKRREYRRYGIVGAAVSVCVLLLMVLAFASPKPQGTPAPAPKTTSPTNLDGSPTSQNPTQDVITSNSPPPTSPLPASPPPRRSSPPPRRSSPPRSPPPSPLSSPAASPMLSSPASPMLASPPPVSRPPLPVPAPRKASPPPPPTVAKPPLPPAPPAPPMTKAQLERYCFWSSMYLPDDIFPARYDLFLNVTLQQEYNASQYGNHVMGRVMIRVRVPLATSCFILHADSTEMKILSASWRPPGTNGSQDIPSLEIGYDSGMQQMGVMFAQPIPASYDTRQMAMTKDGPEDEDLLGQLIIEFKYNLTTGLDGFYLSQYTEPAEPDTVYVMASTQFQSIAARKAFPCFDEPRFKARLNLSIRTNSQRTVLSNMPIIHTSKVDNNDGTSERQFEISPPMSTYLMAWVIGDLEMRTDHGCDTSTGGPESKSSTVPISVYSTPSKIRLMSHALEIACAAVQRYTATLGVLYPLPKLDLVGIPDFAAGAMENWGLITFRETAILSDPSEDDIQQAMNVGTVVAHEISHQWFGNLVTCAEWGELWLNEGLATYFEKLGADAWRPQYDFLQSFFFTDATMPALVEDSVNATHPLSTLTPFDRPSQIDNYFDGISYDKGAAVFRMLRLFTSVVVTGGTAFTDPNVHINITAPIHGTSASTPFSAINITTLPFRRRRATRRLMDTKSSSSDDDSTPSVTDPGPLYERPTWETEPLFAGLKLYLEFNAYGAVTADVLWSTLSHATGLPINIWMSAWTFDRNYPVVHVDNMTFTADKSPKDPSLPTLTAHVNVHQSPILSSRTCGSRSPGNLVNAQNVPMMSNWWLPISAAPVSRTSDIVQVIAMTSCNAQLNLTVGKIKQAPVLLNVGRYGFYRVNYTEPLWTDISQASRDPSLVSSIDMAGLMSDAYRLNEKRQLSIQPFLNFLAELGTRGQAEYAPWYVAVAKLNDMRLKMDIDNTQSEVAGQYQDCIDRFDDFIDEKVTAPIIAALGLDFSVHLKDSVQLRLLRPLVLSAAGRAGAMAPNEQADKIVGKAALHAGHMALGGINPDVREVAYCLYHVAQPNERLRRKAFDEMKALYLKEKSPVEKRRLLMALTCAQGTELNMELMDILTTPDVRLHDVGKVIYALATRSGEAFTAVWSYLTNSDVFATLLKRWPTEQAATYSLGLSIKQIAAFFTNNLWQTDIERFYTLHHAMLDTNFLAWYTNHRDSNRDWLDDTLPDVCTYLERLLP